MTINSKKPEQPKEKLFGVHINKKNLKQPVIINAYSVSSFHS